MREEQKKYTGKWKQRIERETLKDSERAPKRQPGGEKTMTGTQR